MNASNPIEPKAAEPKAASDAFPYEPSMEEILASIRRIIADDQSLPRAAEADRPDPALDEGRAPVRIEPTLAPHMPTPPPDSAPLRAHLLRGETVELDFRAMAARQTGLASVRETAAAAVQPETEAVLSPDPRESVQAPSPAADVPDRMPSPSAPQAFTPQASAPEDEAPPPTPTATVHASGMAHGTIAAPQYAGPGGPADHDGQERIAATVLDLPASNPSVTPPEVPESVPGSIVQEHPLAGRPRPSDHATVALGHDAGRALPSDALFSAATDTSVTAAFRTLAATRLADNSDELLDIAREMIRPLLKNWIDDNVPSVVERMVRAEIERVARGGR